MDEHNDTHPNAYRAEAAEKLAEATRLTAEAEALEAQAKELEDAAGLTDQPTTPEKEADASSEPQKKKLLRK